VVEEFEYEEADVVVVAVLTSVGEDLTVLATVTSDLLRP
jgi:hypothetical protein